MGLLILILGLIVFVAAHSFVTFRAVRADAIERLGLMTYRAVRAGLADRPRDHHLWLRAIPRA